MPHKLPSPSGNLYYRERPIHVINPPVRERQVDTADSTDRRNTKGNTYGIAAILREATSLNNLILRIEVVALV